MGASAAYVVIALVFAVAGGVMGKSKGSSFWLWFLISGIIPVFGLLAAIFYRFETEEFRRMCPECGKVVKIYDALCVRCGAELDYPEVPIAPESWHRVPAAKPPAGGSES
jgi:hypothetical protein